MHRVTRTILLAVTVVAAACGGGQPDVLVGDGPATATSTTDTSAADQAIAARAESLPGCDLVDVDAPAVADVLASTVRTEAFVGPAVLTDDELGGRTLTATLVVDDGASYQPVYWAVQDDPEGLRLLPLTQRTVEVSPPDADTSRLLGADEDIVQGDTPGSGGMALGSDCSRVLAQELAPPPPPPAPGIRDDLIVAAPQAVAPGDVVTLTFPQETDRGIAFQLDEEVDGGWVTRWWMTSDGNGGQPDTVRVGADGYGYPDVGVGGPGPDRVLIHPDASPGEYRVCTANAGEDVCARLVVESR